MSCWQRFLARAVAPCLVGGYTLVGVTHAAPEPTLEPQVLQWIDDLNAPRPATREAARDGLSQLGPEQRHALEQALGDLTPATRFEVLYLLQRDSVRLQRQLRGLVEGPDFASTYPEALAARAEVLRDADAQMVERAVVLLRRRATNPSEQTTRHLTATLHVLTEVVQRRVRGGGLGEDEFASLGELLELDLGESSFDLAELFAAAPRPATLTLLRARLADDDPLVRARAARLLGEVASAHDAEAVAGWLATCLEDADAQTRLSALVGLSHLPGDFVQAGWVLPLLEDPHWEVVKEALRVVGERGWSAGNAVVLRWASDRSASERVRTQALISLGRLGALEARERLVELASPTRTEREIQIVAAWSLGAMHAPDAVARLRTLIDMEAYAQEDRLYWGLARLPGDRAFQALCALLDLGAREDPGGTRRVRALAALGRVQGQEAEVARVLERILLNPASNDREFTVALEALVAQASEPARMVAARLGVRSERDRDRLQAVMSALATLGPPEPSATREALERKLSSYMRVGGVRMGTGVTLRTCAAEALAVYDARQARELIRAAISSLGRGEADQREGRTLARILARFGDTSRIDSAALPVSETERETGDTFNRLYYQNQVGIDLLYARDFPRAILEFQRMLWSTPLSETASYNICCAYALDGDVDAALRWLRRAVRHAYRNPDHMRADPDLERLQGLPRFQRLLDQLTLEDEVGAPPAYSEWPSTVRPQ